MGLALNAELDRPLYLQLVDALRGDIAAKRAGERIDSEPALVERFGVSRFTVSRAIEVLVDEGLIRRRQGLGSFVAPPPLRRQPSYLTSFTDAVEAQGRVASHRLLGFGEAAWRDDLPYPPAQRLVRLDRLRLVDTIPTAIHASVLSAEVASRIGLTRKAASAPNFSLYRLFAQAGLTVSRGVETLRARAADAEEHRLLELGDDAVVMEVVRSTFDSAGALIDFVRAVYDARRYAYQAEIRGADVLGAHSARLKEDGNGSKKRSQPGFGPRLGPWDDRGDGGGKADRAHHRARRPRRPVV
ncbi:MAG TPA: GntR family transcriptional regulator [Roseiarcus sp.]|nr:GntR family transcriptional regulator [Roseiarcus sp.]